MQIEELERIASDYHSSTDTKDKFIEDISQYSFCNWVEENYPSHLNVCEMGYGEGITAKILNAYFQNYHVIEGAPSLVEKAKNVIPGISIEQTLFEDYLPSDKFDTILALHVLEHVDNPIDVLNMMKKWIKPDGEIIILVPNKNSIHRLLAMEMGLINNLDELSQRDHLVGHQRVYDFDWLKSDVNKAGFKVVREAGFFLSRFQIP